MICHTRELAYQRLGNRKWVLLPDDRIKHEFERFAKYFPEIKTGVVYGGTPMSKDKEMMKDACPHILIGTPGRVLGLLREKDLKLDKIQQFVLDECDKCLDKVDMRKDVAADFHGDPKEEAGDDVQRHDVRGDPHPVQEVHAGPARDPCG